MQRPNCLGRGPVTVKIFPSYKMMTLPRALTFGPVPWGRLSWVDVG